MINRQDEIALKAVRKATLKNLSVKKRSRLEQLKAEYEENVRQINIQFAEDPERLKAKYAADDYAKSERAKKRADKKIAKAKEEIQYHEKIRKLSGKEEVACSIIQGIGCALYIAGVAILDTIAVRTLTEYVKFSVVLFSLFGSGMIFMYLFSLLKHAIPNFTAKKVFNRLTRVEAFINIALCYSLFTITKIQGLRGWILFGIICLLCFTGIMFYAISGQKHEKINTFFFIASGICGIFVAIALYQVLATPSFTMICFALAFYLVGIIIYKLRSIKFMPFIADLLMLLGSIYIFFAIFYIAA